MIPIEFRQFTVPGVRDLHQGDAIPETAKHVRITALSQAVRWRDDGGDPSASVGHRLASGGELIYSGPLHALKFIAESAGASIAVTFYR